MAVDCQQQSASRLRTDPIGGGLAAGSFANIARREEGSMPDKNRFDDVFRKLKAIFKPYARKMDIAADNQNYYLLNTRHIMKNKQPLCFGGVRLGKNYVSFYLMSVYASPELLKGMSPELKKRMQGKSCFNFKEVDEKLFKELDKLTKAGAAKFSDAKFIEGLRKAQRQ
jgi:hypothetical protein